jgi:hypothetical protein
MDYNAGAAEAIDVLNIIADHGFVIMTSAALLDRIRHTWCRSTVYSSERIQRSGGIISNFNNE